MTGERFRTSSPTSRLSHISQVPVRKTLATRLAVGFILAALLPAALSTWVTFRITRNSLEEDVLNGLEADTEARVNGIERYARERRRDASTLSRDPEIVRAMGEFTRTFELHGVESPEYVAVNRQFRPFLAFYQEFGYHDLFLIAPSGNVVFTVARENDLGTNLKTGPYRNTPLARVFDRANTLLETEVSDFEFYEPSQAPGSFVASPIMTGKGLVGVVALQIDTSDIYRFATDYHGLGKTGEIVIASRQGDEALVKAPLRHDDKAAFHRTFQMGAEEALPIQNAVMARRGKGTAVDYRGRTVLAAWRYLPSFRWGIVVKMDADEALAPIADLRLWWASIGFVAAGLIALSALFLSRTVSVPLRRLTQATRRIAAGNLSSRADVLSADETGQLARTFNRMADQLERNQLDLQAYSEDLERMVRERTVELQRSNTDLEQFAYVASHDLQEPLRMVASFVTLLERRYKGRLDEKADRYIHHAVDGAQRMQQLLGDLLAYSRAGRDIRHEDVDMNQVLTEVKDNLQAVIAENNAEVSHDDLPMVAGTHSYLVMLLQNLVGNAIKFRGDHPPRIRIASMDEDHEWRFSVSDNGIGIEKQFRDRIFEIFQRLHSREEYEGTGIGLSMCRKIVERHGGRIWLESTPGVGTTFHFTISKEWDEKETKAS